MHGTRSHARAATARAAVARTEAAGRGRLPGPRYAERVTSSAGATPLARARGWLRTWGPLLPVLLAEFIVLLGFGALLPVLPLYVQEQGVDGTTLGLIIAAWAIAKLISEPIFGWLADRGSRKPQMVVGLVILAVSIMLPVVFTSAVALFVLRFIGGVAAGMYDPAARGLIVDATREDQRGEAFGIYTAFQMGGFLFGPVLGAMGASLGGGFTFPFILTGVLTFAAAALLLLTMPGRPHLATDAPAQDEASRTRTLEPAGGHPRPHGADTLAPAPVRPDQAPLGQLLNRLLIATLIMSFGFHFAFGTYEVVWSLFMTHLGASVEWVGVTFALFALPSMIVAPIAGRMIDRRGPIRYVVIGGVAVIFAGTAYAVSAETEPLIPSLVVPVEAVATSFLTPALFAMTALATPYGRSATAQGLLGATGMIALIVSSIAAGVLWDIGPAWPFWLFVATTAACLALGLLVYRGATAIAGARAVPATPGRAAGVEAAAGIETEAARGG